MPGRRLHDFVRVPFEHGARRFVDDGADVGFEVRGIADHQFFHVAGQQPLHLRCDVLLHAQHSQRRAALSCAVERRLDRIDDDLFRQRRAVDDHRVLAAGLRDQRADRSVAGGQRAIDDPRRIGGAREGDPRNARIGHRSGTDDGAVARQEMQHVGRHARLQQQAHSVRRHQRRLLGRLRQHGIACRQCSGDLSREDREREIPGTDAGEHAASVQAQLVAFAGRSRQTLRACELVPGTGRVVAQEIDGFAHFGDAVRHRLARLAHAHRDEFRRALFEEVGRLVERVAAHAGGRGVPGRLRLHRDVDRRAHVLRRRIRHAADDVGMIRQDCGWCRSTRSARRHRPGVLPPRHDATRAPCDPPSPCTPRRSRGARPASSCVPAGRCRAAAGCADARPGRSRRRYAPGPR